MARIYNVAGYELVARVANVSAIAELEKGCKCENCEERPATKYVYLGHKLPDGRGVMAGSVFCAECLPGLAEHADRWLQGVIPAVLGAIENAKSGHRKR